MVKTDLWEQITTVLRCIEKLKRRIITVDNSVELPYNERKTRVLKMQRTLREFQTVAVNLSAKYFKEDGSDGHRE